VRDGDGADLIGRFLAQLNKAGTAHSVLGLHTLNI